MSILTYLILFLVAAYLFKINPVLCVVLVGAVVFFKVRGFFGGRKSRVRSGGTTASEAALVALCVAILERSGRESTLQRIKVTNPRSKEGDPLEGLFLD